MLAGSAADATVATFTPFDVNRGFTVVAEGDVALNNPELEGSVDGLTAGLANPVTVEDAGNMVFVSGFAGGNISTAGGGEVHHHAFTGLLPCAAGAGQLRGTAATSAIAASIPCAPMPASA